MTGLIDGYLSRKNVRRGAMYYNQQTTKLITVALTRYQSIIDSRDGGEIDYDSVDAGMTKPTKSAIRVNDLLETITGSAHLSSQPASLTLLKTDIVH